MLQVFDTGNLTKFSLYTIITFLFTMIIINTTVVVVVVVAACLILLRQVQCVPWMRKRPFKGTSGATFLCHYRALRHLRECSRSLIP
jgi:hypothetical protein